MRRGIGIAMAWLGATLLAVLVAAAAVGSVRSQVTDEPTPIGSPSAAALASDVPADGTTTTTSTVTTTAPVPDTTSTLPNRVTTTTGTTTPTTTTPTTTPPSSTSTTTTAKASYSRTFDTEAGSVRVIVDGGAVTFGGAFPNPGWTVDLEDPGPERVRVQFERNDEGAEVEFSAWLEDGELVTRIEIDDD